MLDQAERFVSLNFIHCGVVPPTVHTILLCLCLTHVGWAQRAGFCSGCGESCLKIGGARTI